jgi:hypothetical protein
MRKTALVSAAVATAVTATLPALATTTWQRLAASTCVGDPYGGSNPLTEYYIESSGTYYDYIYMSTSSGYTYVSCPFIESDLLPDNDVTAVSIDWYCDYSPSCSSPLFDAATCVDSGWTQTCSAYQGTGSVSIGSASLSVPLTAWSNDSGNGYAYVALRGHPNSDDAFIVGMTVKYTH